MDRDAIVAFLQSGIFVCERVEQGGTYGNIIPKSQPTAHRAFPRR